MTKAYKCDRCDEFYTSGVVSGRWLKLVEDIRVTSTDPRSDWQEVDLCKTCEESLEEWFGGDTNE